LQMLAAMGHPMFPVPMKPTRMALPPRTRLEPANGQPRPLGGYSNPVSCRAPGSLSRRYCGIVINPPRLIVKPQTIEQLE
jgi:hypothetical protein